jgi:carbamate kinase
VGRALDKLADTLNADRLLVLTDVPAIIRGYGMPGARPIRAIDTVALSAMTIPAGSMGPKGRVVMVPPVADDVRCGRSGDGGCRRS